MHSLLRSAIRGKVFIVAVLLYCYLTGEPNANAQNWAVHHQQANLEFFCEPALDVTQLTAELDSVKGELTEFIELPVSLNTVQIVIFRSTTSYQNYLSTRIPEALHRRAIFYRNGDINQIYAVNHAELVTDLRHEYTHALLHQTLPFIPLWVDEGIAEFLEEPIRFRSRSARLSSVRWKCRTGWTPDLFELEHLAAASTMTSNDYRDSWAWVHYLHSYSDSSRNAFRSYLQAIAAGEAPGTFSSWLAQHAPEVAGGIGPYFRRFRFSLGGNP